MMWAPCTRSRSAEVSSVEWLSTMTSSTGTERCSRSLCRHRSVNSARLWSTISTERTAGREEAKRNSWSACDERGQCERGRTSMRACAADADSRGPGAWGDDMAEPASWPLAKVTKVEQPAPRGERQTALAQRIEGHRRSRLQIVGCGREVRPCDVQDRPIVARLGRTVFSSG